jgi:hypothetical protein
MQGAMFTDDGAKAEAARHTAHDETTAHDLRSLLDMTIDRMPAFSIANREQRPPSGKEQLACILELCSKHHFFRLLGSSERFDRMRLQITDTPTCRTD